MTCGCPVRACFSAVCNGDSDPLHQLIMLEAQPPRAAAGDPLGVQRGGGLLDEDDKVALPAPPDRNGRQWVRVVLSSVLLKYAYKITCQFSSRRALSVIP